MQPFSAHILFLFFLGFSLIASVVCLLLGIKYARLKHAQSATAHFAPLLEHLPYYYVETKSKIVKQSTAFNALFDTEEKTYGLRQLTELLREEDVPRFEAGLAALDDGEKTFSADIRLDGGNKRVLCHGVRLGETGETLSGVLLWFNDISPQEQQICDLQDAIGAANDKMEGFLRLLNASPAPIWLRDAQQNILYCNRNYLELIDKEENAENGRIPELHIKSQALASRAVEEKQEQTARHHIVVKGERRLYHFAEIPMEDGNGTYGFARDISEQEKTERDLREHMAAQANLLESSGNAVVIYSADKCVRFFNNAFIQMWELEEAWLEGKPSYGEVLDRLREMRLLPEQVDFGAYKKNQLALFTNLIDAHEEFMYLPNGRVVRAIVIPYALGGLLITYEDMTEHITLERKYNTLIAVKRATIDHLYEGVAVFAEDGKIELYNPVYAHIWGISPTFLDENPHITEIIEETRLLYDYGDDWEAFKAEIAAHVTKREPHMQKLERSDGSIINWSCIPLPDGAMLMTYLDITDSYLVERSLRAEKEALAEADTLKSGFLSNVSYELRSPLTSIRGFAEILQKSYFGEMNEKQEEYIEGILDASMQLNALINDILDIASIDAGYMTLDVEEFDLYEALEMIAPILEGRAEEQNLGFKFTCSKTIGTLLGDKKRITQVVSNLVNNAIRFSKTKGKIALKVKADGKEHVIITVKDNGPGIPAIEQPHVFEKFYKREEGGSDAPHTALALPVVKSFVELHGGMISLESEIKKGTVVTCRLPRHNRELLKQSKKAAAADA